MEHKHSTIEDKDEKLWEAFCEWHQDNWSWKPTKAQRSVPRTHAWAVWIAYQAGAKGREADQYAINPMDSAKDQDLLDQCALTVLPGLATAEYVNSDYDNLARMAYLMAAAMMRRRALISNP